ECRDSEQLCGYSGVKDMRRMPAVILTKQAEIVVGVMEDDLHVPILHQRAKLGEGAGVQRIDDGTMMLRGELQQIYPIDIAMETRTFGVECNFADVRDRVDEKGGFFCGVQVNWLVRICHTSIYHDLRAIPPSPR